WGRAFIVRPCLDRASPPRCAPRPRGHPMKLFRALRADPLLLALTVILTLATWAPLTVTPFLPFSDLHNNAAASSILIDAARGKGTLGYHYHVNWMPVPYWTGYLIMATASAVGGVLFAA